jgi:hypothetical protein
MRFTKAEPRRISGPAFVLTSFFFAALLSGCGPDYTPEELAEATAEVRQAYYDQDYHFGAELGDRWTARAPEALELRAWTAANRASAILGGDEWAREIADEMITIDPGSPWSSFALVMALLREYPPEHGTEALEASEKVLASLPDSPDAFILRARVLNRFLDKDTALSFLNGTPDPIRTDLDVRAYRATYLAPSPRDRTDTDVQHLIELFEGILAEEPNHVAGNYGLAALLTGLEIEDERAQAVLEHAASISPSIGIHRILWAEALGNPSLSAEEQSAKITADVRHVLANFPGSPARWAEMASSLDWYGFPELQVELEEKVLADYPDSPAAETVLGARFSTLANEIHFEPPQDPAATIQKQERLADQVREFIARPEHTDPSLLLDAYWNLFLIEKDDPAVSPARLSKLAQSWSGLVAQAAPVVPQNYFIYGALPLAYHPECLDDVKGLLKLAGPAIEAEELEAELANKRRADLALNSQLESASSERAANRLRASWAMLSSVTALAMAQEGLFEEAETALGGGRDVDPESDDAWTALPLADLCSGAVEEMRAEHLRSEGDDARAQESLRSAERFYLQGLRADYFPRPQWGMGWINPNEHALRALFEKMHGDLHGFDQYLAAAREEGWEEHRAEVLARRIEDPKPILPFALKNLDGQEVTSESYLGKVVVINFWGTW